MGILQEMPRHDSWSLDEQLLREAAYHEAGHAVLAKLTGTHLVGAITSGTNQEHAAFECEYRPDLQFAREAALGQSYDVDLEDAVISAAGAAAQARFMHKHRIGLDAHGKWTKAAETHVFRGAHGDVERVRSRLGTGHWVRVTQLAYQWLRDERIWAVVESLAAETIRRNGIVPRDVVDDVLHFAFVEQNLPQFQALSSAQGMSPDGE